MIRPLRQWHRMIVCTLCLLLPVAFAVGLAVRKPVPVVASLPSGLDGRTSDFGKVVWTKMELWPGQRILTNLRRNAVGSVAVELIFRGLAKPDVLVYWAAGKETINGLPDDARLLGPLSNRAPISIPANVRGTSGRLVLYSLADHEVVAVSKPLIMETD